jgi:DNA-binding response OmpR family regulator
MNPAPRILFVDDHEDTLDLFAIVLSQQNYEVVTASSVARAMNEAMNRQFDLLVLDSNLKDGSGVDLCKKIRETDQTTPIVFCSGLAFEKNRQEAMSAGAQAYLVKPVSVDRICETVHDLLSRGRRIATDGDGKASGDLLLTTPSL